MNVKDVTSIICVAVDGGQQNVHLIARSGAMAAALIDELNAQKMKRVVGHRDWVEHVEHRVRTIAPKGRPVKGSMADVMFKDEAKNNALENVERSGEFGSTMGRIGEFSMEKKATPWEELFGEEDEHDDEGNTADDVAMTECKEERKSGRGNISDVQEKMVKEEENVQRSSSSRNWKENVGTVSTLGTTKRRLWRSRLRRVSRQSTAVKY